ncbi:molybdenum cofactor sulfurase isoform X5 [Scleropages formosus]|uniref:molybdenum cofactor sulfurase isoform X5 n=1 Tax=Scleropages formosus TaxID=113540 RepID=UPI000878BA9C|nr:molybdenum cofactor sulfurase isoform X5 [Scleropages formosus]
METHGGLSSREPLCASTHCDPRTAELLWSSGSFAETWPHYGYSSGSDLELVVREEFARVRGITYLDHAGTTLFAESQINGFFQDLCGNVYAVVYFLHPKGNPHSHNPSSRLTHDTVERVRYRILQHFNTNPDSYTVVFTSGCTAALKLVAECFPWQHRGHFSYLTDNHTSVVGMRGLATRMGATALPVTPEEVEGRAGECVNPKNHEIPHLFCFPAQSNFSGRKYPVWHVRGVQAGKLYPSCAWGGRWFVLLDAAGLASCSPLDLQETPADFVSISFYKMFGFPTGIGALLVRNTAAAVLSKSYFGGGTAAAYLAGEDFFIPKPTIADRFEDGTISFLDIVAVHHGFDTLQRLTGGMERVQLHTFGLARHTFVMLSCLRHGNGQPVAQVYSHTEYEDPSTQGAIVNFNLLDAQGTVVGYSWVGKLASLFNIQLRTGCFCNTGACQQHLSMSNQQVKSNLQVDHWPLGPLGLQYDRLWMVVNINGVCMSQKQEPRLCLIKPTVHWASRELHLYAPGLKPVSVPLEGCGQQSPAIQLCQSKVCGDRVQIVDCGDSAANWLSEFLEKPCRLIRQNPCFTRGMRRAQEKEPEEPAAALSLANEAQYLIINTASVEVLQKRIMSRQGPDAQTFDIQQLISRFRANLVINGAEAFEEDDWGQVQIGNSVFQVVGQCERCHMIGIDQDTGARTLEPLLSLSACHKGKVTFGVYLVHRTTRNMCNSSALCVGCPVNPQLSTDVSSR